MYEEAVTLRMSMNFWKGLGELSLEVTADGLGGEKTVKRRQDPLYHRKKYMRDLLYEKPTKSGLHATA